MSILALRMKHPLVEHSIRSLAYKPRIGCCVSLFTPVTCIFWDASRRLLDQMWVVTQKCDGSSTQVSPRGPAGSAWSSPKGCLRKLAM